MIIKVCDIDFILESENNTQFQLEEVFNNNGIKEAKMRLSYDTEVEMSPLILSFYLPALNILTSYNQMTGQARIGKNFRPEWNPSVLSSRLSGGSPVVSLIDYEENNVYTISVSDIMNSIQIKVGLVEEDATVKVDIVFFATEKISLKDYQANIRIDQRKIAYAQALQEAENYLFLANSLTPCYVPEIAKLPVYSTWYSYHVNFTADELLKECVEAKKLGIKSIFVDDGWQMSNLRRGYTYCGDWEIEATKIPNIKDFVNAVHEIGLKVVFWFSIPFLGMNANCFNEFKGMLLDDPTQPYCVLDPRYPKVREYLTEKYVRAIKEWKLDGLKLDFIDSFKMTEFSAEKNPDMDYEDIYQALNVMMLEIREKLQEINPEVILEFRQTYIGPLMQTYGNMFRVGDCPCDSLTNRTSAIDMRLNMHSVAVHSDMLMWHYEDSVESAAKQLLSVFFTVPQISVRLNEIPEKHKQMLKHYLGVWLKNKDVLLDGTFNANGVEGNYTYVKMTNKNKVFYVDFGKNICEIICDKEHWYINATPTTNVYVDFGDSLKKCRVYDVLGNIIKDFDGVGLMKIEVPISGMLVVNGEEVYV